MNERKKKKVLATSWHPGGVDAIRPVIKALIKEKKVNIIVVGHQFSEDIFKNNSINYKTIGFYGLEDVSLESMRHLLAAESPDLILTGTSAQDENNKDVIEQTITLAGREQKIKTLAVLDFWANYSLRFNDIYTGEVFKFLPDKIAVMDGYAKNAMLKESFQKDRIVITGNPAFDNLEEEARNFTVLQREYFRKRIGLNVEMLIFYAANAWRKHDYGFWDLDNIKLVKDVLNGFSPKEKKRIGLAIKLHPRTPKEDAADIIQYVNKQQEVGIRIVADTNIEREMLILTSDLILTANSTMGIKAVYMKKPCISIQPGLKSEDLLIISKLGVVPVGYTAKECKRILKKAITSNEYREEMLKMASKFRTDGKATDRVKKLVYQMLEIT